MPRCNPRRCAFIGRPCFGCASDLYCTNRMTPKQCDKKMKELGITDIKEFWKIINKQS